MLNRKFYLFSNDSSTIPRYSEPCRETYANGLGNLSMRRAMYGDMAWAHTTIGPMTLRQISECAHPLWVPYGPGESGPAPFKQRDPAEDRRRIDTYERDQPHAKERGPRLPPPEQLREEHVPDRRERLKSLLEGSVPDMGPRVVRQDAIGSRAHYRESHLRRNQGLGAMIGEIRQDAEIPEPPSLLRQRRTSTPYDQPDNTRDRTRSFSSTASTLVGSREGLGRRDARPDGLQEDHARGVDIAVADTEDQVGDEKSE